MATKSHIKQHFIPVCYLRGFSNNDKNLHVYDKCLSKVFCKAFEHIGYEEHFYRIDRKFLKDKNLDENYYETDFFAKNIESEYNRILKDLQKRANAWLTSRKTEFAFSSVADSDHFAAYIGIQHLRLPGIREMHYNSYRKGQDKTLEILKGMIGHIHPELKGAGQNISIDHDERFGAALHSFLYSDKKIIDATQDKLLRKSWAFFVSPENVLFTSDNPIVVINRLKLKAVPGDFNMPGAQIIFPISGNILLSMWDDDCFDHSKHIKNGFNLMGAQEARTNNVYQYANAIRQIYQAGNDFSIADEFLADNKGQHLWYPQPTIEVYGG